MNMECEEDGTEKDTETCDPDGEQTTVVIEVSTTTLHKTPTTEETVTATTTEVTAQEETDTAKAVPERPLEKHAVKTKTTMSLHAISHLQKVQQDGDSQKEHAQ